jgi:hypothetical protein
MSYPVRISRDPLVAYWLARRTADEGRHMVFTADQ